MNQECAGTTHTHAALILREKVESRGAVCDDESLVLTNHEENVVL
jgi:hypothetical protein